MRLANNVKSVSKLFFILLLLASFIIGALLSYVWTMGFYAPQEFHLPSRANLTIEKVEFTTANATFFNVTVLNPSYSNSSVRVEQILITTAAGTTLRATGSAPSLPHIIAPGNSRTFKAYLNWGNYTGQTVNVLVIVTEGSGAALRTVTPLHNITIAGVNFDPPKGSSNFTVTIQTADTPATMNVTKIYVNGKNVTASPLLPFTLPTSGLTNFTLARPWSDLQGKSVTVIVETLQGFIISRKVTAPDVLKISSAVFNTTDTSRFNLTIQNVASQAKLDITQIKVKVGEENVTIANVVPQLPCALEPSSPVSLMCSWNWSGYQGKGTKATVTVDTQQGFSASYEASIP